MLFAGADAAGERGERGLLPSECFVGGRPHPARRSAPPHCCALHGPTHEPTASHAPPNTACPAALGLFGIVPVLHLLYLHADVWHVRTACIMDVAMGATYLVGACVCVGGLGVRGGGGGCVE